MVIMATTEMIIIYIFCGNLVHVLVESVIANHITQRYSFFQYYR